MMTWEFIAFCLIVAWCISKMCNTIYEMYVTKQKTILAETLGKEYLKELENVSKPKVEVK